MKHLSTKLNSIFLEMNNENRRKHFQPYDDVNVKLKLLYLKYPIKMIQNKNFFFFVKNKVKCSTLLTNICLVFLFATHFVAKIQATIL